MMPHFFFNSFKIHFTNFLWREKIALNVVQAYASIVRTCSDSTPSSAVSEMMNKGKTYKAVDLVTKKLEASVSISLDDVQEVINIARNSFFMQHRIITEFGKHVDNHAKHSHESSEDWRMELTFNNFPAYFNIKIMGILREGPVRIVQGSCQVLDGEKTKLECTIPPHFVGINTSFFEKDIGITKDMKSLTINASICYVTIQKHEQETTTHVPNLESAKNVSKLASDMELVFRSGQGSDMNLVVGGQKLQVHKTILMARFPYLAKMMESGMKESHSTEIEIKEDDVAAFSDIIRYVYCDLLPKDLKNDAIKLLPLADKYQLLELKEACEVELEKNLAPSNICQVLIVSDLYKCLSLKKTCLQFLGKWRSQVDSEVLKQLHSFPHLLVELFKKD